MKIERGDIIRKWHKDYLVEQVYSVGRRYRKRHGLCYPIRIRLREMKNGFVTDHVDDFAMPESWLNGNYNGFIFKGYVN